MPASTVIQSTFDFITSSKIFYEFDIRLFSEGKDKSPNATCVQLVETRTLYIIHPQCVTSKFEIVVITSLNTFYELKFVSSLQESIILKK